MKYIVNVDPRITLIEPEKHSKFPVYVRFTGEFSEDNCMKFRNDLVHAENHAIEAEQKVLPIVIDSYGGDVYALMACVDAIRAIDSRLKIATIVEGKAMSCGAVLFTCGHEGYRFIGPNATVMIHEVSNVAFGKNEEVKVSAKEGDRLNDKILEIMSENCGHSKDYFAKEITSRRHADWYLDAQDCINHNVANIIGVPRFGINVTMDVNFIAPEPPVRKTVAAVATKKPTGKKQK